LSDAVWATEADLCSAFLEWVGRKHPDVRAYAEWAGWDILLVLPDGAQVGIQAKLRLNAEVLLQTAPSHFYGFGGVENVGPTYRAVLVPKGRDGFSAIASRLGLLVLTPGNPRWMARSGKEHAKHWDFRGGLEPDGEWLDWNTPQLHELPATPTDSIAGSPCPVTLTAWKLGALGVLAELEVIGSITAKRIRAVHGIDPGRWTQSRWLRPVEGQRGLWRRAEKCPAFDRQHPSAYALALEKARAFAAEPAEVAAR
jgi:hypothetical protein